MNNLLSVILDAPVIFSILFFSINGWKRGAVRPFINFLGSLISTFTSIFVSIPVSKYIYNSFIKSFILDKLHDLCLNQKIDIFPNYLIFIFQMCKINKSALSKIILKENPENILVNMISPFFINFIRVIVGSIVFFVIMTIVRRISKVISSIFKTPVLSQCNSALGAFFGLLKGVLISWVCILFLKISLVYWNNPPKIFSQNSISSSFVFGKFYNFNPVTNKFMNNISDACELEFLKWDLNQKYKK